LPLASFGAIAVYACVSHVALIDAPLATRIEGAPATMPSK
jgi:hypothetical protein